MQKNRVNVSVILSVVTLAAVFYFTEIKQFKEVLLRIEISDFFLSILFFCINYLIRAYRLGLVLQKYQTNFRLNAILSVRYGALNYFLPFKLGELSLPVLLKNHYAIDLKSGSLVLIKLKSLDLLLALMSFLGYIFLVKNNMLMALLNEIDFYMVSYVVALFFVCGLFVLIRYRLGTKILSLVKSVYGLKRVISTGAIWVCLVIAFAYLARSIGILESLDFAIGFMLVMLPLSFLPTNGIANLGSHELAWYSTAIILGVNSELALTSAFTSHILLSLVIALIWGISLFFNFDKKN